MKRAFNLIGMFKNVKNNSKAMKIYTILVYAIETDKLYKQFKIDTFIIYIYTRR